MDNSQDDPKKRRNLFHKYLGVGSAIKRPIKLIAGKNGRFCLSCG